MTKAELQILIKENEELKKENEELKIENKIYKKRSDEELKKILFNLVKFIISIKNSSILNKLKTEKLLSNIYNNHPLSKVEKNIIDKIVFPLIENEDISVIDLILEEKIFRNKSIDDSLNIIKNNEILNKIFYDGLEVSFLEDLRNLKNNVLFSSSESLTGLNSKKIFKTELEISINKLKNLKEEISKSKKERLEQIIKMGIQPIRFFDAKGLKAINDNLSHDVGDIYLLAIATSIQEIFQETFKEDKLNEISIAEIKKMLLISHVSGDEFYINIDNLVEYLTKKKSYIKSLEKIQLKMDNNDFLERKVHKVFFALLNGNQSTRYVEQLFDKNNFKVGNFVGLSYDELGKMKNENKLNYSNIIKKLDEKMTESKGTSKRDSLTLYKKRNFLIFSLQKGNQKSIDEKIDFINKEYNLEINKEDNNFKKIEILRQKTKDKKLKHYLDGILLEELLIDISNNFPVENVSSSNEFDILYKDIKLYIKEKKYEGLDIVFNNMNLFYKEYQKEITKKHITEEELEGKIEKDSYIVEHKYNNKPIIESMLSLINENKKRKGISQSYSNM